MCIVLTCDKTYKNLLLPKNFSHLSVVVRRVKFTNKMESNSSEVKIKQEKDDETNLNRVFDEANTYAELRIKLEPPVEFVLILLNSVNIGFVSRKIFQNKKEFFSG
jgi:hypothetical protein